jgi:hypothetical protein
MRTGLAALLIVTSATVALPAQRSSGAKPPAMRMSTTATCAADIGKGVKTGRRFCDVVVASTAAESVAMTIPAHTGAATLQFDLHNRFSVPAANTAPSLAFSRHTASVAVIRPTGAVIGRGAVMSEFRSVQQLFDRIAGPTAGMPKTVAPGPPEAIRITIPAGVNAIGIVGESVVVTDHTGEARFPTPGRPVALVSNLRIEYRPR